uniref:Dynein heavy chain 7, axonemal n=1 Tax=Anthurium amnicola TaxID=1678845 RepID=A0A1D1YX82_9ARAE
MATQLLLLVASSARNPVHSHFPTRHWVLVLPWILLPHLLESPSCRGFPAPRRGSSTLGTGSPSVCPRCLKTSWSQRTLVLDFHCTGTKQNLKHLRLNLLHQIGSSRHQLDFTYCFQASYATPRHVECCKEQIRCLGSEILSVVVRPSNQLKITFLEAKDITDLGTLKEAAKIFVPGGATLYSARTIKIKEDEILRSYYFYEFGIDDQHLALVAAVNSGKAVIAGAAAPQSKWEDDGVKLRSAAISLSVS